MDITLNNSTIQSVVDINDTYANGYKQGNINLITNKLDLNNTILASKDLTIKNEDNNKLQSLIVDNSTLDVNNDIISKLLYLIQKIQLIHHLEIYLYKQIV